MNVPIGTGWKVHRGLDDVHALHRTKASPVSAMILVVGSESNREDVTSVLDERTDPDRDLIFLYGTEVSARKAGLRQRGLQTINKPLRGVLGDPECFQIIRVCSHRE